MEELFTKIAFGKMPRMGMSSPAPMKPMTNSMSAGMKPPTGLKSDAGVKSMGAIQSVGKASKTPVYKPSSPMTSKVAMDAFVEQMNKEALIRPLIGAGKMLSKGVGMTLGAGKKVVSPVTKYVKGKPGQGGQLNRGMNVAFAAGVPVAGYQAFKAERPVHNKKVQRNTAVNPILNRM